MAESLVFLGLTFGAVVGFPVLAIAWGVILLRRDRAKVEAMGPDQWGSQDIDSRFRG
jgi:hypothetical protein